MTKHLLKSPPQHLANLTAETLAKGDVGIEISGPDHSVRGYTATGGQYGIKLVGGAKDFTVDGFSLVNPINGIGLYSSIGADKQLVMRARLLNGSCTIDKDSNAQHAVRLYGLLDPFIENLTASHFGAYTGGSFLIKSCKGGLVRGLKTFGRPGSLGPNKTDTDRGVVTGLVLEQFALDMNGDYLAAWKDASPFVFQAGAANVTLRMGTSNQRNPAKAHFRCEKGYGSTLDAQNIVIEDVVMTGGAKVVDGTNPAGITFVRCSWNGKTVGSHGETV